jgi:UDP-N-acetylglucosamine--N-acetylmuramyl-(pentapeptide) pyrophosphoryl-undecaprenol N-acetylglucosamine transferase
MADRPRRFVLTGGGTGGHVTPALAVATELARRGHEAVFIGTAHGLEWRLVPAAGFRIERIEVGGLKRVGWKKWLRTAAQLPVSTARAWRLLGGLRPAAVFSTGGYVAGPVVLAAVLRRIPVIVMEPNAMPGFTNRVMGRWIERALLGLEEAARYFPPGRSELTGVPVRKEFFTLEPRTPQAQLCVLVTGGSQGSRTLNRAFRASWPLFVRAELPLRFSHQSGPAEYKELLSDFAKTGLAGQVSDFITGMPSAFAEADLIVGRSGANAVAEICAAGKPAILVPFPYAADDHQRRNAEALVAAGAARLVSDAEMTGERLFAEVRDLALHRERLASMAAAARRLARPGAAARAADILENAAAGGRGG